MNIPFTGTQKHRLTDLGLKQEEISTVFDTIERRDNFYKQVERNAVTNNRNRLMRLFKEKRRPSLCILQRELEDRLIRSGFTQVTTPVIISKLFLERMSVGESHPLNKQVFWLDRKTCLRPMLAPNLYAVSQKMMNFSGLPLRLFEIGPCFRKESEGRCHLSEFTMLNLVEWGTPEDNRENRIKELAADVLDAARIVEYHFAEEDSTVYGNGLDIVGRDGLELASSSMGPHYLDSAWKITCSWVGIGFGLERMLCCREGAEGIHRYSKSISFLDGASMNIK